MLNQCSDTKSCQRYTCNLVVEHYTSLHRKYINNIYHDKENKIFRKDCIIEIVKN